MMPAIHIRSAAAKRAVPVRLLKDGWQGRRLSRTPATVLRRSSRQSAAPRGPPTRGIFPSKWRQQAQQGGLRGAGLPRTFEFHAFGQSDSDRAECHIAPAKPARPARADFRSWSVPSDEELCPDRELTHQIALSHHRSRGWGSNYQGPPPDQLPCRGQAADGRPAVAVR